MVSLPLCHIDGKRQEKEWYVPNPAIYIRTLVHIFIPFGLHSSRTLNPGRPMMMWSAIKLPDGLRSFTELRICGTSSVCCGDTFRTPSASGLTSCPSFSFSATSGVGGSSSNCIFRSSAASSDFNCFSSSSFFHTFPAISYNCETSFLHLVLRLVLVNDGRNPLQCVQEIACGGYRVSHRQHAAYVIQGY